jgi:hypothetical protein
MRMESVRKGRGWWFRRARGDTLMAKKSIFLKNSSKTNFFPFFHII